MVRTEKSKWVKKQKRWEDYTKVSDSLVLYSPGPILGSQRYLDLYTGEQQKINKSFFYIWFIYFLLNFFLLSHTDTFRYEPMAPEMILT